MTILDTTEREIVKGDSRPDTTARPIRVAYVVHTFDMGGAERIVALLAKHLDRSRFQPMIICLNRNGNASTWGAAGDVPIVELHKRSGNDPGVVGRLAAAFRRHQVDVVHSNNWGTLLETVLARRWVRVPGHVHVEHGAELADLRLGFWRRRLRGTAMKWALRRADSVVGVCRSVREGIARRCGFRADRVRLIANGVEAPPGAGDQAERERVRRDLKISPRAVVVGSVGRLAPVKDFETAVEAVAQLVGWQ